MKRGTPSHPKTLALESFLGVERYSAVGILETLWHFAAQYARRGDIGRHSDASIAQAVGWKGDPAKLVKGLLDSQWLDACPCHRLRIHDWPEHADRGVANTKEVEQKGFLECYPVDASVSVVVPSSPAQAEPKPGPSSAHADLATATATATALAKAMAQGNGNGGGVPGGGEPTAEAPETAPSLSPTQEQEYVRAVWEEFEKRRGPGPLLPSPAEYGLVLNWLVAGYPLVAVLRGIRDCGGRPRTLMYCAGSVRDAAEYNRKALA